MLDIEIELWTLKILVLDFVHLNFSETLLLTWDWSWETGSELFNSLKREVEEVSTLVGGGGYRTRTLFL